MLNIHKTRDGKTMFISNMTNEHLIATVKLYLSKVSQSIKILEGTFQTTIDMRLSGINKNKLNEQAEQNLKYNYEYLLRYIPEIIIRGIDVRKDFIEAFGRDGISPTASLPQLDIDEDDDDDYEHYY